MTSDLVFSLMLSVIGKYHLIISVINKEKLVRGKKMLRKPNTSCNEPSQRVMIQTVFWLSCFFSLLLFLWTSYVWLEKYHTSWACFLLTWLTCCDTQARFLTLRNYCFVWREFRSLTLQPWLWTHTRWIPLWQQEVLSSAADDM